MRYTRRQTLAVAQKHLSINSSSSLKRVAVANAKFVLIAGTCFFASILGPISPSAQAQAWKAEKPYSLEASSVVSRIIISDFNGDGKGDLALIVSGKLQVLRGDGTGGFAPFVQPSVSPSMFVTDLAAGDFNGDGNSDLIVVGADLPAGRVHLYFLPGIGNGQFGVSIPVGEVGVTLDAQSKIAAGAFIDHNGYVGMDLAAISASTPRSVLILANDGHGSFYRDQTIEAAEYGRTIVGLSTVPVTRGANLAIESISGSRDQLKRTDLLLNSHGSFTLQRRTEGLGLTIFADYDGDTLLDRIVSVTQDRSASLRAERGSVQGFDRPLSVAEWSYCNIQALAAGSLAPHSGSLALDLVAVRTCSIKASTSSESSLIALMSTAQTSVDAAIVPGYGSARGSVDISVVVAALDGKGIPSGDVGISVGGGPVQMSPLFGGVGHIMAIVDREATSIESVYGGSDRYAASAQSLIFSSNSATDAASSAHAPTSAASIQPQTAGTTSTILELTSGGTNVSTIASGKVLTMTATVRAGGYSVNPGLVNFFTCDATTAPWPPIHLVGTGQLTRSGVAVLKFVPGIGKHSYKAVFAGTGSNQTSFSSQSSITVTGKYPTSTTLSLTPGGIAGSVTAIVVGAGPWSSSPTGIVTLEDVSNPNYILGTAELGSSVKSFRFLNALIPTDTPPESVAIGDFNGDGKLDMAVANSGSNTLTVLLGNGDGTFIPEVSLPTDLFPQSVVLGDFNGDGKLDLAVCNSIGNHITVLLGNGDGTFMMRPSSATSREEGNFFAPTSLAIGDFNGDGIADLAVTNARHPLGSNPMVQILLGNGDGSFRAGSSLTMSGLGSQPALGSQQVVVGDFDGDGNVDLAVVVNGGTPELGIKTQTLQVAYGNGDGTFQPTQTADTGVSTATVADFDGDGYSDLAYAKWDSNTITLLRGNRERIFKPETSVPANTVAASLAVADFDQDGKPDLAIVSLDGTMTVMLGKGDGTFNLQDDGDFSVSLAQGPDTRIAVGDFNGDGEPDIALTRYKGLINIALTNLTETATALAINIAPIGKGIHLVQGSYPGDLVYAPSAGTIGLPAVQVLPNLDLKSSVSPAIFGESITFTCIATVAGMPVRDGTVLSYSVDGHSVDTEPTRNGILTWTTSLLPAGKYDIGCSAGDSNYDAVQKVITQIVDKATPVSVVVNSSLNPSTFTDSVTLTVTVNGASEVRPTGTVTIFANKNALGTGTLNAFGVMSISTSTLPPGANAITVSYNGDSNYK